MSLLRGIFVWLVLALPAFADIERPVTQSDTLGLLRDAYIADPQISNVIANFDERYISFQVNGAEPQISFPDNLHIQLQQAKTDGDRQTIMDHFLDTVLQTALALQQDAPINIANVYPVLRHQSYLQVAISQDDDHGDEHGDLESETTSDPATMVSFPFVADMRIFLVEDAPQFVKFLSEHDLETLDLTAAAVLSHAIENTAGKRSALEVTGQNGLYLLKLDGNFETSFLMVDSLWNTLDAQIGPIVAVVAARDLVLLVDGDDATAIGDLRTFIATDGNQFNYPISTTLITWKDGNWVEY